jgi:hypothetical protein
MRSERRFDTVYTQATRKPKAARVTVPRTVIMIKILWDVLS